MLATEGLCVCNHAEGRHTAQWYHTGTKTMWRGCEDCGCAKHRPPWKHETVPSGLGESGSGE